MARRSDHTRSELKKMAIVAGQQVIANEGFRKFSARQVAKEIGYTVGTLYNVFDSYADLILHINAATLDDMHNDISGHIDGNRQGGDAVKDLAAFYIGFADNNYNRWNALFEFNLPQDVSLPDWYRDKIKALFLLVETPLMSLFGDDKTQTEHAAKVLWAGIHGICQLGLTGKLQTVGAGSVQILAESLIYNFVRGLKS